MAKKTHYPSYDVMKEKEHWDEHTRSIVESRLYPNTKRTFLKWKEEEMLRVICSHLVADQRAKLIDFIISHIDQTLSSSVGEGQRKSGVPEAKVLVRKGLIALNKSAVEKYQVSFIGLDSEAQHQLLLDVSQSRAPDLPEWEGIPQQEFFKKLHTLTIESYYSHPVVWSEIGYGGPAYPRGYVRTQLGQLDPWEAQPEHE
jgi:hypothetical protein